MFPLWLLEWLVVGSIALCSAGALMLLVFLVIDSRDKQIW